MDVVIAPWAQKDSDLVLNIDAQLFDKRADKLVFSKSVGLRGSQDRWWTRAVHFLARDIAEKRQLNPGYGQ